MKRSLMVILALLIGGCASRGEEVQRYRLAQLNAPPAPMAAPAARLLQLHPLHLATYIDSQGLLYQTDDIAISQAHGHQWAEAIGRQLSRALRQQLSQALPALQILESADISPADRVSYHLNVSLERFQGHYAGTAVLSGYWLLRDHDGALLETRSFHLEHALPEDGYPALVRSLGQAWSGLARHISADVLRIDQQREALRPALEP